MYNLVHYLEELDCEVTVRRNNELDLEEIEKYDKILLSPGPGIPDEAGLLKRSSPPTPPKRAFLESVLGSRQ